MSRTFVRQDTQIRNSDLYDDTVAAGSTLESAPTNIEEDLNALRSQMKRAIWDDGAGNWYDDIPTINAKKRAIRDLNFDLDDIEEKRFLFRAQVMTDVTVANGQNYQVLSAAGSETPTVAAAVNGGTAQGAVVATLAGDVGSHALTEVAGPDAISPKNLVLIRDAVTGDPISSSNREIYGLLQAESGTADGEAFNDTTKQVQISFVRINATGDDLEAVPVIDIQDKVINYAYVRRVSLDNIPEYAFLTGVFLDQVPTSTSVTLDNAIDNQVGPATQTDRNIDWRITDTFTLKFQDSGGARDLLAILPNAAGDEIEINTDDLDINNVNRADFLNGARFDSGGTGIDVGDVAGVISSTAGLSLVSNGANDLNLTAGQEITFVDTNKGGSTFAGALKLSDTATEWSNYETLYGEVSLLNAIYQAGFKENRHKTVAVVTSNTAANADVGGVGGGTNLDAQLGNYSGVAFLTDVDIFLNGVLLRNGADASANHDVYPGTSPANGQLRFEFAVKAGGNPDVITMIIYGTTA
jgi:hypothetical protein